MTLIQILDGDGNEYGLFLTLRTDQFSDMEDEIDDAFNYAFNENRQANQEEQEADFEDCLMERGFTKIYSNPIHIEGL